MLFSDYIPDKLKENSNTSAFLQVVDELQKFKTNIIANSLRVDNFALLTDKKWIFKKLEEFGITGIPFDYPLDILQQYLLNVGVICSTRGSKVGLELYCSLLSLGQVTIDDSGFYGVSSIILLDSRTQGFVTDDNEKPTFYLTDGSDVETVKYLTITIKSRYFNGEYPKEERVIKEYIEKSIGSQLKFSPKRVVTFNYESFPFFSYHKLLNPYFV